MEHLGKNNWYVLLILIVLPFFSCDRDEHVIPDINTNIKPLNGLTTTVFSFDLSKTFSSINNDRLFVRWDWEGDGIYDTKYLHEKVFTHRYFAPGKYNPKIEIKNLDGQSKDTSYNILVEQGLSPPRAAFEVKPQTGHIFTTFTLDASITSDDEDSLSSLLFSWDFDGDGNWDTDFTFEKFVFHKYNQPGEYNVALELVDRGGLKDTSYLKVYVSDREFETDMLLDKRGFFWNYYGTIKIGDQWWFSKNLRVSDPHFFGNCSYMGPGLNGEFYGALYTFSYLPVLCPDGWRVPDREDWEELFQSLGSDDYYKELILGGSSGFNAVLGGSNAECIPNSGSGLGHLGHYWSTTELRGGQSLSCWVISFVEADNKQIMGWSPKSSYYSVRCVRD